MAPVAENYSIFDLKIKNTLRQKKKKTGWPPSYLGWGEGEPSKPSVLSLFFILRIDLSLSFMKTQHVLLSLDRNTKDANRWADITPSIFSNATGLTKTVCFVRCPLWFDAESSAVDGVALSCSVLLMPSPQVLLLCSNNLNFDPSAQTSRTSSPTPFPFFPLSPCSPSWLCVHLNGLWWFVWFYWRIYEGTTTSVFESLFVFIEAA